MQLVYCLLALPDSAPCFLGISGDVGVPTNTELYSNKQKTRVLLLGAVLVPRLPRRDSTSAVRPLFNIILKMVDLGHIGLSDDLINFRV